jgi:hypothetical protein
MANSSISKNVSKSETGHAKNAANFSQLINVVEGYGVKYSPTVAELTVAKLKTLRNNIDVALTTVANAETPYRVAVDHRQDSFDGMSKLATRVLNALAVVGTEREIKDAQTLVRKIRGGGKTKPKPKTEDPAKDAKGTSTSQMSYDNRVSNFMTLVALLNGILAYKPNEADLKVASLTSYLNALPGLGEAVGKAAVALAKARASRDGLLYGKGGGAMDVGLKVKKYVKSVFGSTSSEYRRVAKIELKNR